MLLFFVIGVVSVVVVVADVDYGHVDFVVLDDDNINVVFQGLPPAGGSYLGSYQRIRHLSGLSEGPSGGYPPNNYGYLLLFRS